MGRGKSRRYRVRRGVCQNRRVGIYDSMRRRAKRVSLNVVSRERCRDEFQRYRVGRGVEASLRGVGWEKGVGWEEVSLSDAGWER